ncbi:MULTISPECIES: hypothetical protein [Rhizobium]|nr:MULTISPECIES: hypothetical protein [Rhizobium]
MTIIDIRYTILGWGLAQAGAGMANTAFIPEICNRVHRWALTPA